VGPADAVGLDAAVRAVAAADPTAALEIITREALRASGAAGVHVERHDGVDALVCAAAGQAPAVGRPAPLMRTPGALGVPVRSDAITLGELILHPPEGRRLRLGRTDLLPLADLAAAALRMVLLEEDVRSREVALEDSMEARFRLVAAIGYALRDNLGVAAEFAAMAGEPDHAEERRQDYLRRARRGVDGCVRLIGELMDLTRAETGNLALSPEPLQLAAVLRDMVRDQTLAAGTSGILWKLDIPDHLPMVNSDLDHVRHVLDALLSNAVRYTPPEGVVTVRAGVRMGRRAGDPARWLCVTVADTGPGLPEAERVFEEVHRAEQAGGPRGFRLAIARRVVRLLDGDLTLVTAPGRGAAFTLWLPLAVEPEGPGSAGRPSGAGVSRRQVEPLPGSPSGPRE